MSIREMWKSNAIELFLMILLNLALMSLGALPWAVLGTLFLLGGMFFSYRQGMGYGHQACAILDSVNRAQQPDSPARDQLDSKVLARAWSVDRGVKGALLSALIPYVASCLYIAATLLKLEPLVLPCRLVAVVLAMPALPLITYWVETFEKLTPAVTAVLMISPFLLPACSLAGYLQGPRLWKRSEEAMAQGRRRARAKSRVAKKRAPKQPKPEI